MKLKTSRVVGFDESEDDCGGHLRKRFSRVDDNTDTFMDMLSSGKTTQDQKTIQDSCQFRELFKALLSGKSSYMTYLNELVCPSDGSEPYLPQYVSVLRKFPIIQLVPETYYNECVGSRLANVLGYSTVYNIPHKQDDCSMYDFLDERKWFDSVLSVDFVPPECNIVSFDSLGARFDGESDFSDWIDEAIWALKRDTNCNLNLTDANLQRLKEDMCRMFLFRMVLCLDYDISNRNISIIYDKNGDFVLAPNYDMEYLFHKSDLWRPVAQRVDKINYFNSDLRYCVENFPHIVDEFIFRINDRENMSSMRRVLNSTKGATKKYKKDITELLFDNIKHINQNYCRIKKESEERKSKEEPEQE